VKMDEIEISVIAPCFNEEDNIEPLSRRLGDALSPLGVAFELICVDDASTDSTKQRIQQAQDKYDYVVGAFHDVNQGIVGGWRTGYEKSRGKYVVTIDADLQYRPEDIVTMYERINRGDADMVQGWRKVQVKRGLVRWIFTAGFSFLLNLVFWMRLKDNKSGFILYRRDVLGDLLDYRSSFAYFQHFITIAANSKGYRIQQVPVTFDQRHSGESFIQNPFKFSFQAALDIPKAIWEYRITRPHRKVEKQ